MADQLQSTTQGATNTAQGATSTIDAATSGILSKIYGFGSWVAGKGQALLDRVISPEQRAKILKNIQEFMLKNPKISAFLGMDFVLTGIPLGLFFLFTLTIAIFALLVGLILGLLAAVLFIVFAVGVALMFVLPTIFFTTMAACFLFLWGLGGYYIIKAFTSEEEGSKEGAGPPIGDRINNMTGGMLGGFMDSAKSEKAKGDISGFGDEHTKPIPGHKENHAPTANGQTKKEA